MSEPGQLPVLKKLAEEFLSAVRAAARALGTGELPVETLSGARLVNDVSVAASRFTAAALNSPDFAAIVEASPDLVALTLVSPELAHLAQEHPELAELAVTSPNLARIAIRAPELVDLARASPPLAVMIEVQLGLIKNQSSD